MDFLLFNRQPVHPEFVTLFDWPGDRAATPRRAGVVAQIAKRPIRRGRIALSRLADHEVWR
jgi:hypothetical protein